MTNLGEIVRFKDAIKNEKGGLFDVKLKQIAKERRLQTKDKDIFRAAVYSWLKERIDAGAYDDVFDLFFDSFIAGRQLILNLRIEFADNDRSFMKCLIDAVKDDLQKPPQLVGDAQ